MIKHSPATDFWPITRTYKQEKLVNFDVLQVPSLEHNNEIKGESLDLIKYIDSHFEGPSLLPEVSLEQHFHTMCYLAMFALF